MWLPHLAAEAQHSFVHNWWKYSKRWCCYSNRFFHCENATIISWLRRKLFFFFFENEEKRVSKLGKLLMKAVCILDRILICLTFLCSSCFLCLVFEAIYNTLNNGSVVSQLLHFSRGIFECANEIQYWRACLIEAGSGRHYPCHPRGGSAGSLGST